MIEIPTIRIEMEGIRSTVAHMFHDYNNELEKLIQETFKERLTDDWVKAEVNQAVIACIQKSIQKLADNYELQQAITRALVDNIKDLTPL